MLVGCLDGVESHGTFRKEKITNETNPGNINKDVVMNLDHLPKVGKYSLVGGFNPSEKY